MAKYLCSSTSILYVNIPTWFSQTNKTFREKRRNQLLNCSRPRSGISPETPFYTRAIKESIKDPKMASTSASASASTSSTPTAPTNTTDTITTPHPSSTSTPPTTTSSSTHQETPTTRAQAEARAAVLATLSSAGASYTSNLQSRAADLHANAAVIDKQQTDLAKARRGLAGETAKLEREVDKALKGMRDFGDVHNWAEMLERDFMVLEETMRLVEGGGEVERESGGSTWK